MAGPGVSMHADWPAISSPYAHRAQGRAAPKPRSGYTNGVFGSSNERLAQSGSIVWSLANETHTARQHGCIHVHAAATFESQPIHGAGKRDHPRAPSIRAPGERYPSESFLIAINHPSILVRPEHASTCVCGRVGVRVRVCRREQDVVYSCVEPFSCCAPRKWE